jgi:hypothetical protein
MPFYEPRPQPQDLMNIAPSDAPPVDPSLVDTFGAAFRTQNVIGSFISSRGVANPYEEEKGFNAIDYVKDDQQFAPFAEEFAGITNRRAADAKKQQIIREQEDARTIASAGAMGVVASVAAGVVDLPTLLPFGGAAIGGSRVAGRAAGVAMAAGLDAGLSEAALQATQATRTAEETILNVGGSILVGGALGALAARLLPKDSLAMSRKVEGQAAAFEDVDRGFRAASAGAAAKDTGPLKLKDEGFISKLPIVNQQDPLIRLQLGELDSGRQTVRQLAETPLEYADNAKGVATEMGGSVETRMKMWHAPLYRAVRDIDTEYAKYFHSTPEPTSWQRRLSPAMSEFDRWRGGGKMTFKQFKEEVGRAAYMGGKHEIPEVANAAKVYRELDEQLKTAAIDAKLFPEDVDVAGDISHRFRMYNKERIIANRSEFARILQDYFVIQRDIAAKIDTATAKASTDAKAAKEAAEAAKFGEMSDAELRSVVDDVIDNILGNADGRIPYEVTAGPRGALKERVLKIETAKIHAFTENDIEQVMRSQIRTMSADVEIAKKFGSVDMAEEIRKINDEANAKIAAATTQKARQSLEKARKDAIRDVEGIRDRLRGTYKLPSDPSSLVLRAGRIARNINYVRLLGGMTISAVPDMAKVVFTHGLTSTFRDGFIPMVRNFKAFRLAGEEVKSAGTALDMVLDSRTMAMADIVDEFGHHSKFERGLSALSSKFGVVSLMAPWNAAMKQFSGLVTMTNILKASERVAAGKGTQKDISRLAASGIDEDMAKRIAEQYTRHGTDQDGVLLARGERWGDKKALESFRAAVVRDVDRIIVTPGQDKPLWMSTELGKTVGQFKSFAVSSMQRTMLAGIQQRDAATLNGLLLMLGLGAVTYGLKESLAGREPSDDPAQWAVEAFDKSGIAGWLMEANNIAEKASRGRVGLSAVTGEQVSRYASRNVTGAFLGPTADAVSDIFQVSGSIFAGDTTKSDLRKARQLLPMQNLFYVRGLLNQVEEATGDALGLPDTRRQ